MYGFQKLGVRASIFGRVEIEVLELLGHSGFLIFLGIISLGERSGFQGCIGEGR